MLVPVETEPTRTNPYPLRGAPITVPDDFDAPLAELWGACAVAEVEVSYGAAEEALASACLPGAFHKDPADRLIVALARRLQAALVTADGLIRAYPHVTAIW